MLMPFLDEFVRIHLFYPKSQLRSFLFIDFNVPSPAGIQGIQCPFREEFLELLHGQPNFDAPIQNHVFLFRIFEAPSYFSGLNDRRVNVFLPSFPHFPRVIDFQFGCQIFPIQDLLVDDIFLKQLILSFFPVVCEAVCLFWGVHRRILLNDTSIFVVELRLLLLLILHFGLLINGHFFDSWRLFFVASHVLSDFPPLLLLLLLPLLLFLLFFLFIFCLVPCLFFWQWSLLLPMPLFIPWSFSLFFRILLPLPLPLSISIFFPLFCHLFLFLS